MVPWQIVEELKDIATHPRINYGLTFQRQAHTPSSVHPQLLNYRSSALHAHSLTSQWSSMRKIITSATVNDELRIIVVREGCSCLLEITILRSRSSTTTIHQELPHYHLRIQSRTRMVLHDCNHLLGAIACASDYLRPTMHQDMVLRNRSCLLRYSETISTY